MGASCPCRASDCSVMSARAPSSCRPRGVSARAACSSLLLKGRLEPPEADGVPLSGLQEETVHVREVPGSACARAAASAMILGGSEVTGYHP